MFKMLSYSYVSCDKILPNKHIRRLGPGLEVQFGIAHWVYYKVEKSSKLCNKKENARNISVEASVI